MKKLIAFLVFGFLLQSCADKVPSKDFGKPEKLIEIKNGMYTEWYSGKKQIKFKGALDQKGNRNGKWVFYSESGNELSISGFENGKKSGFSIVKYPNGVIHYRGEYRNDEMVGIWTTYDDKGKLLTNKDYGFPDE